MCFDELIGECDNNLYNSVIRYGLNNRILILNYDIDDDIVENIIMHIIRFNIEDYGLPKEKRKPIKLIINSPGGDVFICQSLIDVIKNSDTPIVGVGVGMVASAAYYIFLSCTSRVAYKNTTLLQHDGNIQICTSGGKSKNTMQHFDKMDERIKQFILDNSTMTEEYYDNHYEDELYFYADEAKEYGLVDLIIGEDISFNEIFCE